MKATNVVEKSKVKNKELVEQILGVRQEPRVTFDFSDFLKREYRFGLEASNSVCVFYMQGHCPVGNTCTDRHPIKATYQNLVCKHWLRGLCKKGEQCDFLHEYNLRNMPECNYYSRHQTCPSGEECLYQHVDLGAKLPVCPHYERGFCSLGPNCSFRHVQRDAICKYYMAGFCPYGRECTEGVHARFLTNLDAPLAKLTANSATARPSKAFPTSKDPDFSNCLSESPAAVTTTTAPITTASPIPSISHTSLHSVTSLSTASSLLPTPTVPSLPPGLSAVAANTCEPHVTTSSNLPGSHAHYDLSLRGEFPDDALRQAQAQTPQTQTTAVPSLTTVNRFPCNFPSYPSNFATPHNTQQSSHSTTVSSQPCSAYKPHDSYTLASTSNIPLPPPPQTLIGPFSGNTAMPLSFPLQQQQQQQSQQAQFQSRRWR